MSANRLQLSRRAHRIAKAEIRTMTVECERMGGINLAQGVCDMAVPEPVLEGVRKALVEGVNSYTRHDGLAVLREAIARKMEDFNGITADPETEIVVSGGSTGALYCACLALLDPGDEVIVFEPYYGYHISTLLAVDAVPSFVRTLPPNWSFTKGDLERSLTPNTKAIIVNTPGNPSGKVFSIDELQVIADFAVSNDLFIFTDEIYEYFVYDHHRHVSPATIGGVGDRTISISGYSKTFSITGWRIGYTVSSRRWAEMIGYVNDLVYVCAPAPLQVGVAAGISALDAEYYRGLQIEFNRKRSMICSALRSAGFDFADPDGAYYVLADASHLPGRTSKERAMWLLEKTGVASVPGEAFYSDASGENLLRFCYAKEDRELNDACERLRRAGQ